MAHTAQSSIDLEISKRKSKDIIGLPPNLRDSLGTDSPNESPNSKLVLASMPICRIIPAWADSIEEGMSEGMHIYSLNHTKGNEKWRKVIIDSIPDSLAEYTEYCMPPNRWLDIAYLMEGAISDSWGQEYGSSAFEEFANMGSKTLGELRTVSGENTAGDALSKQGDKMTGGIKGMLGSLMSATGGAANKATSLLNGFVQGAGNLMNGSRVDFPSVWNGSSFHGSYSITTRLYNPDPSSDGSYVKYIIGPLIQILAFITPINDDDSLTYHSSVMCSAKSAGQWEVRSGYVSSVEVIKGGESSDFSFDQRPNIVDVRISFGQLYNVVTTSDNGWDDRTTLNSYIENLFLSTDTDTSIWNEETTINNTPEPKMVNGNPNIKKAITNGRINNITRNITNSLNTVSNSGTLPSSMNSVSSQLNNLSNNSISRSSSALGSTGTTNTFASLLKNTPSAMNSTSIASPNSLVSNLKTSNYPLSSLLVADATNKGLQQGVSLNGLVALSALVIGVSLNSTKPSSKSSLQKVSASINLVDPISRTNMSDTVASHVSGAKPASIGISLSAGSIGSGNRLNSSEIDKMLKLSGTINTTLNI